MFLSFKNKTLAILPNFYFTEKSLTFNRLLHLCLATTFLAISKTIPLNDVKFYVIALKRRLSVFLFRGEILRSSIFVFIIQCRLVDWQLL